MKLNKKVFGILLGVILCAMSSFTIFANENTDVTSNNDLDINIKEMDETMEVPIYVSKTSDNSNNISTFAGVNVSVKKVAQLTFTKKLGSDKKYYLRFVFTPVNGTAAKTKGFTGRFTSYNSCGLVYSRNSYTLVKTGKIHSPASGHLNLSGYYYVSGYPKISIPKGVHFNK